MQFGNEFGDKEVGLETPLYKGDQEEPTKEIKAELSTESQTNKGSILRDHNAPLKPQEDED